MQKKLANILFSTRLTATLFLVFAVAMATGTFLDAGQDTSPTPLTRVLIYNSWWFEAIMIFFVINFVGNIFRFRLFRKEKWVTLTFHLAFILILVGAFTTRHFGFEGMMSIREGETENTFLSREVYITTYIDGDYEINGVKQRLVKEYKVDFSERLNNDFKVEANYNGQPVTFELEKYVKGAEKDIVPDERGESYLKVVATLNGEPFNYFIKEGQVQSINNMLMSLNKPVQGAINITSNEEGLFIDSPFEGEYMTMATMETGTLTKDSLQPLILRSRYEIGNMQIVLPKPVVKGFFDVVKKPKIIKGDENGLRLKVTSNGETKHIVLIGGLYRSNPFEQIHVGGLDIALKYGAKIRTLPFSIKLNDFIADRFPGTENRFSAFASEVTVIDEEKGSYNYRIFMNNILDEGGYRFFQSSFDSDEKGSKLSVNHDALGTWITYIGYFILYFGLIAILFNKHTRFADLKRMLNKVKSQKAKAAMILFLCFGLQGFAQTNVGTEGQRQTKVSKAQIDSIIKANITPREHAAKFGKLVVQDYGGRMMPINTFASEVLRKVSKDDRYEELDAEQVLLSMQESPLFWYEVPIIYLSLKKGDSIRTIIGADRDEKYVSLKDFIRNDGSYKLSTYLEEAYSAQIPNAFQKEFKEVDQRVNLLYNTIEGRTLRIFPVPDDENNKWISPIEYKETYRESIKDTLYGAFISNGFHYYLSELHKARSTKDYSTVDKLLAGFKKNQQNLGEKVMLSEDKINAEIFYNEHDVFRGLFSWYLYASTLLFVLVIFQIFKEKSKGVNRVISLSKIAIAALFILHTSGLILRWYISGHAPWSNAYESMIYVAWATMFFGLIFGRKSDLTLASTAFVTAMLLMIAHWNWMDPAIENLEPVLNSYWLMIHVAVIVASYGPFALGMILGVTSLLLMIFTTRSNKEKMLLNIKELTIINEMALTVGLSMLIIGNFLGGMWANESWGRYWGWDPKETWALISIMIYAFVIHMRLVPGLRGRFSFNLASIIAFSSIMFTYFGVNFYLAGLHSYQSGQQIGSFKIIAVAVGAVAILGYLAYRKHLKFYKK
ncbi:cytochrome c biogenesis protein CcsA [Flavobacteriaceae bacterium LMO-SS05]